VAFPVGTVHSIYYDTPWLDSFWDKTDGIFLKKKVRLRWYDPDVSRDRQVRTAFLEVKKRAGEARDKCRTELKLDRKWLDGAGLDDLGFIRLLHKNGSQLGEPIPTGLAPTVAIRFRRHRFFCPATRSRVCLDTSIGVEGTNSRSLPARGHVDVSACIVEIKDIPRTDMVWLDKLYSAGFRNRSFSKYAECMSNLMLEE
jgi:hypothetical protein